MGISYPQEIGNFVSEKEESEKKNCSKEKPDPQSNPTTNRSNFRKQKYNL